ncbi:MAG TPA: hypothetical protein VIT88_03080 [Pyrinomonadaceae bacterium]
MHTYISQVRAKVVPVVLMAMFVLTSSALPQVAAQEKLKVEDVIARHLEALGSAEARNKSRIIQGTAVGTFRLGGSGSAEGGAVIASQDVKSLISIVFGSSEYPYERIGFDGKTVTTGELTPGVRSSLGVFFMRHEMPIREGLLGGVLSTAWPLLDTSARSAKLKYAGIREVVDRKAYALTYEGKNSGGLKTTLFFDAETFRHIRTEYEKRQIQLMPNQPSVTQQQGDSVTRLVEEFSDFKDEGGLMLPHQYKITLSVETLNQRVLQDFVFSLASFSFDQKIDASQFDVRTSNTKS